MTQRNPMNERTQAKARGDKVKGAARKSAASAKPVTKAASSVREASGKKTTKSKRDMTPAEKQEAKAERERERKRQAALGSTVNTLPEYKSYRRLWWIVLIVAVVAVVLSWGLSTANSKGVPLPGIIAERLNVITIAALVVGYAGIIIALIIDFAKIRPLRKKYEAQTQSMSKRELRELDKAIEAQEEATRQRSLDKQSSRKLPWQKKKADEAADESTEETTSQKK